ncbi:MAG: hypothetical protein ACJA07_000850 [Rhodococcus sp. (in: high G+C Gram-positive bacteria)]|jgi:hypothetical protein
MPICTEMCHSRVNENNRSDAGGPGCSIPYPHGLVSDLENTSVFCARPMRPHLCQRTPPPASLPMEQCWAKCVHNFEISTHSY